MVVIKKRVEMRERGPSNPPTDKHVQKNDCSRRRIKYGVEGGGALTSTPFLAKFLQFYRVLALERFTHPVLVPAPLYTKNSRYAPDGIYVENYGNSMVCN